MKNAAALLLMLATIAGAAPRKEAPKERLYLPTTVGDKFVYDVSIGDQKTEVVELVTEVVKKDGMTIVTFSRDGPKEFSYRLACSTDGIFRVSSGSTVYDKPYRLLQLPLREGESWEPEDSVKFTTGREEDIEVPAGKFRAIRVECEYMGQNGRVNGTTFWFSPGMAVIKTVTKASVATGRVQVLKSFTPGRK